MKRATDFHVRLPLEVNNRLSMLAEERKVSRNVIILSALEEFLNLGATAEEHKDSVEGVRKEVFEVKRRLAALRKDVEIVAELLSFFIYHWIGYTPRLEKDERLSLAAEAKERHDRFLALFAKKLALGELSLETLLSGTSEFKEPSAPGAKAEGTQGENRDEVAVGVVVSGRS